MWAILAVAIIVGLVALWLLFSPSPAPKTEKKAKEPKKPAKKEDKPKDKKPEKQEKAPEPKKDAKKKQDKKQDKKQQPKQQEKPKQEPEKPAKPEKKLKERRIVEAEEPVNVRYVLNLSSSATTSTRAKFEVSDDQVRSNLRGGFLTVQKKAGKSAEEKKRIEEERARQAEEARQKEAAAKLAKIEKEKKKQEALQTGLKTPEDIRKELDEKKQKKEEKRQRNSDVKGVAKVFRGAVSNTKTWGADNGDDATGDHFDANGTNYEADLHAEDVIEPEEAALGNELDNEQPEDEQPEEEQAEGEEEEEPVEE